MKIYTRTGDQGDTGLFGGERVPKHHLRVAAYGDVDELNAALGFVLSVDPASFARDLLVGIQRNLFTVGAELATPDPAKLLKALPEGPLRIEATHALEREIDRYERTLVPLKQFILPGGCPKAAALHLARTVCRRAERSVIALEASGVFVTGPVKAYLNRLSDLLFVLARVANAAAGAPEEPW
ncbi:MAG TPA: cob(I)yrinic acid a,c-diamide adenosyltransferase [Gemmatimonadales bacterium]|nr:cob(I)yrinic acid a,c-diamide adenosyltransferase [Gemmatimonadales bacterium]